MVDLILIASSTGGPPALDKMFSAVRGPIKVPVLVVQHMPPKFPAQLAARLSRIYPHIAFEEGKMNQPVQPGHVYFSPGGCHMVVSGGSGGSKKLIIKTEDSPYVNAVRPAADVLYKSVARCCAGWKVMCITLTGMGRDGADGVKAIKGVCDCDCVSVIQKLSSCVVPNMPRSVLESGVCDYEMELSDIGEFIYKHAGA